MKIDVPYFGDGARKTVDIADVLSLILTHEDEVLVYEGEVLYFED